MKNNKILTYLLSGFIPLFIFTFCVFLNKLVPFGDSVLNIYDSFSQYSSMMLGFKNAINNGNIFYSFGAGLGFNIFSSILYYGFSPLNLLHLFSTPTNYPYVFSYITFIRIFLLGLSMSFYLSKKNVKPLNIIMFSTLYSLMGFTSTYYYNFMWIDAIIMLPLVIHGLDKLIDEKKALFYIVTLAITIMLNFYIGYMICIFSLLYFIYRMYINYDKTVIKKFIISSILAGLISMVVLLPSYYALKTGKAALYETTNYAGISNNGIVFFTKLLSGNYEKQDQMAYKPALVYSGIISLVLVIYSFYNKNLSKKERQANAVMILLFYLSFTLNALNYSWQMFQHPYWWESRFSFLFSFFMIITASKTFEHIDTIEIKNKHRIIITIVFIILATLGLLFKHSAGLSREIFVYIFFVFSLLIFIEEMFLINKSFALPLIILCTFLDVGINTYNSLKQNNEAVKTFFYQSFKEEFPKQVEELNKENNNNFYRLELTDDYTSDDGLYFNYNGVNYFNSVRNINTVRMMKYLGIKVTDDCHVNMNKYDPLILSLFNIKYIYGKLNYLNYNDKFSINSHPLSIGFVANEKIKNIVLSDDKYDHTKNKSNVINALTGDNYDIYTHIDNDKFILNNVKEINDNYEIIDDSKDSTITYSFVSDKNYLIIPEYLFTEISINKQIIDTDYAKINKNDKVTIKFNIYDKTLIKDIYIDLMDLDNYEIAINELEKSLLVSTSYKNGHVIEGNIDVLNDGYMFTSIPYEEGMKVYVDNEEIKPDIILNSLMGFDIKKGNHTIYIDYIPKGLIPGSIVSLISIAITCFYLQKTKNHL